MLPIIYHPITGVSNEISGRSFFSSRGLLSPNIVKNRAKIP
jgi:hypothetical protein